MMTKNIRKYSAGEQAFFAAFEQYKTELPNIGQSRINAIEWLKDNGIATKRVEAYHYSDLRRQFSKGQNYASAQSNINIEEIKAHPTIAAFEGVSYASIIFVDGKLRLDLSDITKVAEQIKISSLANAADNNHLQTNILLNFNREVNGNPVDNLTRAMWRDGICLSIRQSLPDDAPLHIIFVDSGQSDAAHFNRHYIQILEGKSATIIESHINLTDQASLNLHHFSHILYAKAKLTHLVVNGENENATNICRYEGVYGDEAKLNATSLNIGGGWTRREGDLYCNGSGMDLKISGAVLAGGKQHVDNTFVLHHKMPENISFQRFKNVVDDQARAIFQGKVIVAIDAQKTDGQQMVQTILLSDNAEISVKPELEIYADDVECAHGATVGALDADMLFYLRARGIPKRQAQKLLIHAFIAEIADELPEVLSQAADKLISVWLNQHLDA